MSFLERVYLLSDWAGASSEGWQSSCPCISSTHSYNRDKCNRSLCSAPLFKSCMETHRCPTCGAYKLPADFKSASGKLGVNCAQCRTRRREYKRMLKARLGGSSYS